MDPVTAAVLLVASTAISGAAAIGQGAMAAKAAEFEKQQLADDAELAKIGALNAEVEALSGYAELEASWNAQQAAGWRIIGADPSMDAFQAHQRKKLGDEIANIRLMGAANQSRYKKAIAQKGVEKTGAMIGAVGGVATSVMSGVQIYGSTIGFSTTPKKSTPIPKNPNPR